MSIFFTSDQHFGHENIIHLAKRPFKTVEEMDKALIRNWNLVVQPNDTVYVLGDFMHRSRFPVSFYLDQLAGLKILIRGNHDKISTMEAFDRAHTYLELEEHDQRFVLFHYPMLSWNKRGKGAIHLYGHVHQAVLPELQDRRAYNVGVELNDYTPISLETVVQLMETKPILKSDGVKTSEKESGNNTKNFGNEGTSVLPM